MSSRIKTEHLRVALFRSCVSAFDFEIVKIQNSILGLNTGFSQRYHAPFPGAPPAVDGAGPLRSPTPTQRGPAALCLYSLHSRSCHVLPLS